MELSNRKYVIVQTNRARCALNKKSLTYSNRARCALNKKSLTYSMKKAFLESNGRSRGSPTANVLKGESIAKVRFNFLATNTYIYI